MRGIALQDTLSQPCWGFAFENVEPEHIDNNYCQTNSTVGHEGFNSRVKVKDSTLMWMDTSLLLLYIVELPRLLYTVAGRKPANPPQESDDIHGIRLDKFPVRQERPPEGFLSLLTPRQTLPQEMFSVLLSTSPSFRTSAALLWCAE